jgi:hypothetical protein
MKYMLFFLFVQMCVGSVGARASQSFEDGATKIEKSYFNGNSISLECGMEVDECKVKAKAFKRKISFVVDFKKEGFKPDFSQITLMTDHGISDSVMMSFSVDCDEAGLEYHKSLRADSVICNAVMRVKDGSSYSWLGVQAIPTYESKYNHRTTP